MALGTSLPELATSVIRPMPFNLAANIDMGMMTATRILLFIYRQTITQMQFRKAAP